MNEHKPVAYRHRDGMFSVRLPGGGVPGIDWAPLYDQAAIDELIKQRDTLIEAIKAALEESPVSRELLQAALKEVKA